MMHFLKAIILAGIAVVACSSAQAITSDDLMQIAMTKGSASGELTGPVADAIKKTTHSNDPTLAVLKKLEEKGGCQFFELKITQPNIPTTDGKIAGDYVTTTKVGTCRGDKSAPAPVVLSCAVGPINCMP
jgi:hypothetical protein